MNAILHKYYTDMHKLVALPKCLSFLVVSLRERAEPSSNALLVFILYRIFGWIQFRLTDVSAGNRIGIERIFDFLMKIGTEPRVVV